MWTNVNCYSSAILAYLSNPDEIFRSLTCRVWTEKKMLVYGVQVIWKRLCKFKRLQPKPWKHSVCWRDPLSFCQRTYFILVQNLHQTTSWILCTTLVTIFGKRQAVTILCYKINKGLVYFTLWRNTWFSSTTVALLS